MAIVINARWINNVTVVAAAVNVQKIDLIYCQ